MRRTTPAIALAVTLLLAFATAITAQRAQSVAAQTGPTPPPPPFSGTPVLTTPTPTKSGAAAAKALTAKQKAAILKIVKKDTTLHKLLGKKSYKVTAVWDWTTKNGSLLGGIVTLRLKKAATIKGRWLDLAYDCAEQNTPPYGRVPYKATYAAVSFITVYVDLQRKRLAGIRPLGSLIGRAVYPPAYPSRASANC